MHWSSGAYSKHAGGRSAAGQQLCAAGTGSPRPGRCTVPAAGLPRGTGLGTTAVCSSSVPESRCFSFLEVATLHFSSANIGLRAMHASHSQTRIPGLPQASQNAVTRNSRAIYFQIACLIFTPNETTELPDEGLWSSASHCYSLLTERVCQAGG